jgi:signal transduction histidine kinase
VCFANPTNRITLVCRPRSAIAGLIEETAKDITLPAGFAGTAELAGQAVASSPAAPASIRASASRRRDDQLLLLATVYIADPSVLANRVQSRLIWFASVIGAASIAAAVGLAAALRAFRRQQALADMKTNFVSSVSHELRAPIASVRLLAEGLQRGTAADNPAKQQEYFGFIVQECRRLSALIENVLDFSRIEHGRKQYEFELIDATALVRQTVTLMQPYADARAIKIGIDAVESAVITADGRAMQQALINLIDNAIKHSPPRSEIVVALRRNGQPDRIELSVTDRGEGIPPEDHERIFERFYRRGSELRRETQGVGIGLSIVKHIVEAHGGTITVNSEVGKGSCFAIEVPEALAKSTPNQPVAKEEK